MKKSNNRHRYCFSWQWVNRVLRGKVLFYSFSAESLLVKVIFTVPHLKGKWCFKFININSSRVINYKRKLILLRHKMATVYLSRDGTLGDRVRACVRFACVFLTLGCRLGEEGQALLRRNPLRSPVLITGTRSSFSPWLPNREILLIRLQKGSFLREKVR